MNFNDFIEQLETIFLSKDQEKTEQNEAIHSDTNKSNSGQPSKKDRLKKAFSLLFTFLVDLIKMPFAWFFHYFKQEFVTAIKKDIRTMLGMAAIMSVLYLFLLIFWLSVSILVGVFFYEKGFSLFNALLFSIAFQVVAIIILSTTLYILSKKHHTRKMLKKFSTRNESLKDQGNLM